jgi:prolyl-tRNA synthetase
VKTPSFTAPSDYAANMEKAEALAPSGARGAATQGMAKVAHARQEHLRRRGRVAGRAAETTVKSLVLATDETNDGGRDCQNPGLAAAAAWRPRHERDQGGKVPGLEGFRFATLGEITSTLAASPAIWGPSA